MIPVTCIIPVRNGQDTIQRAVESAIVAGCDTVLIYDDASTDNTQSILEDLCQQYSDVEFYATLSLVKSGVNYARNFLCEMADNGLIIPLDADDCLNDITPLREAYDPDTWVYGDHIERCGDAMEYRKGSAAGGLVRKNITGISFMFHRRDWLKVGGYDYDFPYCEDFALQCALTNAGIRPKYIETPVYDRYMHPDGNHRSTLAGIFWNHYRELARMKYQSLFVGVG